jgi:hypothetical protein
VIEVLRGRRKREVVVRVWLYGEEAGFAVIDVTYGEVKVEIKKVERVVVYTIRMQRSGQLQVVDDSLIPRAYRYSGYSEENTARQR